MWIDRAERADPDVTDARNGLPLEHRDDRLEHSRGALLGGGRDDLSAQQVPVVVGERGPDLGAAQVDGEYRAGDAIAARRLGWASRAVEEAGQVSLVVANVLGSADALGRELAELRVRDLGGQRLAVAERVDRILLVGEYERRHGDRAPAAPIARGRVTRQPLENLDRLDGLHAANWPNSEAAESGDAASIALSSALSAKSARPASGPCMRSRRAIVS